MNLVLHVASLPIHNGSLRCSYVSLEVDNDFMTIFISLNLKIVGASIVKNGPTSKSTTFSDAIYSVFLIVYVERFALVKDKILLVSLFIFPELTL